MLRHLWKVGLAIAVLTVGFGTTAQAQYSNYAYRQGGFSGYGRSYVRPYTTHYRGGYGSNSFYRGGPVWHDTSHYHYHPGGYVPHGNHYHYIPGHYDLHRTGHYHW